MFISYNVENFGYGYLCFTDNQSIFKIHRLLEKIIFSNVHIIFASKYSTKITNDIYMFSSGTYRLEKIDLPIRDSEEICSLYSYLYDKYGFTNILGYY